MELGLGLGLSRGVKAVGLVHIMDQFLIALPDGGQSSFGLRSGMGAHDYDTTQNRWKERERREWRQTAFREQKEGRKEKIKISLHMGGFKCYSI